MSTQSPVHIFRLGGCALSLVLATMMAACTVGPATSDSDDTAQTDSETTGSGSDTTTIDPTTDGHTSESDTSGSDSGSVGSITVTTGSDTDGHTSESDTSESDTSGPQGACPDSPNYDCSEPPACDENCGVGTSRQDEDGCPRPDCGSGCPDGMACIQPSLWGGCASSYTECTEEEGICECIISDDCGGAWCVPEEALGSVPGISRLESTCGPDDGAAVQLAIGLEDATCVAGYADQEWLDIQVWQSGPLLPGEYPIDSAVYNSANPDPGPKTYGILTIDTWDNDSVSGSYVVGFANTHLSGSFEQTPYCDLQPMCG